METGTRDFPWGALIAKSIDLHALHSGWYVATPVFLEAHMERLVLVDAPRDIAASERDTLISHLNAHFDELFVYPGPHGHWLINLPSVFDVSTRPIDAVLGQSLALELKSDPGQRALSRLLNEIQMCLFDHPLNQAREAAGQSPVNGLWLWGGSQNPGLTPPSISVFGRHPMVTALAGQTSRSLPNRPDNGSVVVLGREDEDWLKARLADLRWGRLDSLHIEIAFEPQAWTLGRLAAWRLW